MRFLDPRPGPTRIGLRRNIRPLPVGDAADEVTRRETQTHLSLPLARPGWKLCSLEVSQEIRDGKLEAVRHGFEVGE